ncbi:MAG: FAD-dependent oxidoreductase [Verrucomicrobiales bacterium]|nr:FAD-dependent oxidoreductase [Verrucomicrobiales bacterium]
MSKRRIIILGGGFAGVKCAQTLSRGLSSDDVEIVLFNAENHLVFTPLLADVIGASVNPLDVVVPLRQLLPGVHCRTEEVANVHVARNEIEYHSSDGHACRLGYDHLVMASGSVANLHAAPGMADHAFPLKNIGDAVALRSHAMEQMEKAETCSDAERRCWFLSFIVTMTDWMRALSRGASPETPVTELMVRHPITVSVEEDGAMAASVIREHRVKNLPVVKCWSNCQLVGCVRTRRLMAHVFTKITKR